MTTRSEASASHRSGQGSQRPPLRLAVFDLDGTLKVAFSPWRYLHEALGVEEQAATYRARFFAGQIDYWEWARLDAALWKGVPLARIESIFRGSVYRPGVGEIFALLNQHRVPTAIISSGLDVHVRQVATEWGVRHTLSNELVTSEGRLTGQVVVKVTEDSKGRDMAALREELGARPQECLAVGDGPADIALFEQAGLAIAVCPRDARVREAADVTIEDGDLHALIPLLTGHFALSATGWSGASQRR
jgi:phosphoserine phosphatase